MTDVVFILGAGASADSGAPLMREFFGRARDLLVDEEAKLGTARAKALRAVFAVRRELQSLHSKTWLDLWNIEEVFAFLEMRRLLEPTPEHDQQVHDLETLIAATLDLSVQFHVASRNGAPEASDAYRRLRKLITSLRSKGRSAACITLNYDLALEQALSQPWGSEGSTEDFDYCLWASEAAGMPVLKLHGSVNWFRCPSCNLIVPLASKDFDFTEVGENRVAIRLPKRWPSHASEQGAHCSSGEASLDAETPVLVPPTWNKHGRYQQILPVWQRAVRSFVVVNPDKTGEVENRFRDRLGRGVPFHYIDQRFEQ